MGTGGFETRPYVCLSGPRRRGGASLRVPRWGLACGGRLVGPRGATSPWAVLRVRARAGLKPAPTPASLGRGVGVGPPCGFDGGVCLVVGGWWDRGGDFALGCSAGAGAGGFETRPYACLFGTRWGGWASLRVPRRGLACGGRLVGPRGATSPWAVLLVRARAGLKPAPTPASLGRGVGVGPPCGFHGGVWLVVGGWWDRGGDFALGCSAGAGAGGFETRPYACLFGTRRGGPGLLAGSTVGFGLWWAVGGTEGGDFALGCSAGAGGFETRPYIGCPLPAAQDTRSLRRYTLGSLPGRGPLSAGPRRRASCRHDSSAAPP